MSESLRPGVIVMGGIDPSGGAGLGVDVLAVAAGGGRAACVATGVAVQGHHAFRERVDLPVAAVRIQLETAAGSEAGALKVGMLGTEAVVNEVVGFCARRPRLPLVLDPLRLTSSGGRLLDADAEPAFRERLLPVVDVLTPNVNEAVWLAGGDPPRRTDDLPALARRVAALGPTWVLLKGGHDPGRPGEDILAGRDGELVLRIAPVEGPDPRGTGCGLASLLAVGLAAGLPVPEAARRAQIRLRTARVRATRAGDGWVLGWPGEPVDETSDP